MLSDATKVALLKLARQQLEAQLRLAEDPPLDPEAAAEASVKAGAFVSLHSIEHALRGCIGTFSFADSIEQTVRSMAVAAGTQDPRFPPVKLADLPLLRFEISVLTPPKPIAPEDVRIGEHGLTIARGPYRGVLLPQVATDWGWTREEFLAQTCRKAGLPDDSWKQPGTRLEAFTAIVFSE